MCCQLGFSFGALTQSRRPSGCDAGGSLALVIFFFNVILSFGCNLLFPHIRA